VKESLAMIVIVVPIDMVAEMIVVVDVVENALVLLAEDTIVQEAVVDHGLVKIWQLTRSHMCSFYAAHPLFLSLFSFLLSLLLKHMKSQCVFFVKPKQTNPRKKAEQVNQARNPLSHCETINSSKKIYIIYKRKKSS